MYEVVGFPLFVILCIFFPDERQQLPYPVSFGLTVTVCLLRVLPFFPGMAWTSPLVNYLPQFYLDFTDWYMRVLFVPTDFIMDALALKRIVEFRGVIESAYYGPLPVVLLLSTLLGIELLRILLCPLREFIYKDTDLSRK